MAAFIGTVGSFYLTGLSMYGTFGQIF